MRRKLPNEDLAVAASLTELGRMYSRQGRYNEAEKCYSEALEIRKKSLDNGHPDVADSLNNLGHACSRVGASLPRRNGFSANWLICI